MAPPIGGAIEASGSGYGDQRVLLRERLDLLLREVRRPAVVAAGASAEKSFERAMISAFRSVRSDPVVGPADDDESRNAA